MSKPHVKRVGIRHILTLMFALSATGSYAIDSSGFATLHCAQAGSLELTDEAKTVSKLKVTGTINARDLNVLKNVTCNTLTELDLSEATIAAYYGSEGTIIRQSTILGWEHSSSYQYDANALPTTSFYALYVNNNHLTRLVLPASLESIAPKALTGSIHLVTIETPTNAKKLKAVNNVVYTSDMTHLVYVAPGFSGVLDVPSSVKYIDDNALTDAYIAYIKFNTSTPPTLGSTTINTSFIIAPNPDAYATVFTDVSCLNAFPEVVTVTKEEGSTLTLTMAENGHNKDLVRNLKVLGTIKTDDVNEIMKFPNINRLDLSDAYISALIDIPANNNLFEIQLPKDATQVQYCGLSIQYNRYLYGNLEVPDYVATFGCVAPHISSVTLPSSIIGLSTNSFNSTNIESVDLSKCINITSLSGFNDCPNLKSLKLPSSLKTLKSASYINIDNLELPEGLQTISECYNWSIKSLTLPSSLESLSDFGKFPNLSTVDASQCTSLTEVDNAFFNCPHLEKLDLSNSPITKLTGCYGRKAWGEDITIYISNADNYNWHGVLSYNGLKEIALPSTLTSVDGFYNCSHLTNLDFSNCINLTQINGLGGCDFQQLTLPKALESLTLYNDLTAATLRSLAIIPPTIVNNKYSTTYSVKADKIEVPIGRSAVYKATTAWIDASSNIVEGGYSIGANYKANDILISGLGMCEPGKAITVEARPLASHIKAYWVINGVTYDSEKVTFTPTDNIDLDLSLDNAAFSMQFNVQEPLSLWYVIQGNDLQANLDGQAIALSFYSKSEYFDITENYEQLALAKLSLTEGDHTFSISGSKLAALRFYDRDEASDKSKLVKVKSMNFLSDTNKINYIDFYYWDLTDIDLPRFNNLQSTVIYLSDIKSLDLSEVTSLTGLWMEDSHIGSLDLSGCTSLQDLYTYSSSGGTNKIDTINLSRCSNLTTLNCSGSQMSDIDLSGLSNLSYLNCADNTITTLDLSGCTKLSSLYCDNNALTELDLSGCTKLSYLSCSNNALTTLDLSNCPNLSNWLYCNNNALTKLDLSGCANVYALYCSDNALTELDLSDCPNLSNLYCSNNALTELDLSDCTKLSSLYCSNNALTELDLSDCPNLSDLYCSNNALTTLDLSGCTKLSYLNCYNNALTTLDLSNCPNLSVLDCRVNALTTLDLSDCPNLSYLTCGGNALTELNLSGCTNLSTLYCYENKLRELDLSSCTQLEILQCHYNYIKHIELDDNLPTKALSYRNNSLAFSFMNEHRYNLIVPANISANAYVAQGLQFDEDELSETGILDLSYETSALDNSTPTKISIYNRSGNVYADENGRYTLADNNTYNVVITNLAYMQIRFEGTVTYNAIGGINDISTDGGITITISGTNINVSGLTTGANVRVYSLNGTLADAAQCQDNTVDVQVPTSGIYVIDIEGRSFKVAVK